MTTDEIHLTITGTPAPQGSKDPMPIYKGSKKKGTRQFTGKVALLESSRDTLKPWRAAVTLQARRQYRLPVPLDVPLSVGMTFLIARPKTVRRPYPSVVAEGSGDLSKLARAVEDALTDAKVWRDDALVVRYHELAKVYAAAGEEPGVRISIRPLAAVSLPGRVAPRQGRPDPMDLERLRKAALGTAEPFSA